MANVISNISVQLLANAVGVKRGVSEAKGALTSYGQSIKGIRGNPFASAEKGAHGLGGSLGGLTTRLGGFAAAFGVAFSAKAMAGAIMDSWEMMDSQKELADQLGISTKALSGLSYISDVVGGDTDALSGSFAKFQKLMGNAANGQEAATKSLAKYGLTAKQLMELPLEDQMGLISDKFKKLESQEQKVVMATDLFGKSGASMINMLSLGSTEINKMIEEAKSLGVVFGDDAAQGASDAEDAMLKLSMRFQGFKNVMATELAPVMTDFLNTLDSIAAHGADSGGAKSGVENLSESMTSTASLLAGLMIDVPLALPRALGIAPGEQFGAARSLAQGAVEPKPTNTAGQGVLAPIATDPVASMVDSLFAPPKSEGVGVLSPEIQTGQGGKDYINEIWDSMRAGGTGDPQLDRAKELANFYEQEHKQRLLDVDQLARKEEEDLKAQEEREKLLSDQTKQYEDQVRALEESKRIQGGFIISKAGRTAAGADFTTGGMITQAANSVVGSSGDIGQNGQIVSELQEQTGYLRILASKPQVASFA